MQFLMSKVRYLPSCRQLFVPARTPGGRHPSTATTRYGNLHLGTKDSALHNPLFRYQQIRRYAGPAAGGANDYTFSPGNDIQPQPKTQHTVPEKEKGKGKGKDKDKDKSEGIKGRKGDGKTGGDDAHGNAGTAWKMFESAATTAASLSILGYGPLKIDTRRTHRRFLI